jgi:hypothetical protein
MAFSPVLAGLFNNENMGLSALQRERPAEGLGDPPAELQKGQRPGEPFVFPYPDLIRKHLANGEIAAAQKLFEFARDRIGPESSVAKALAPPKIKRSDRRGVNRSVEFRWLDVNGVKYSGKWVALLGDDLLGTADSLKDLLTHLRAHPPAGKPLLHHLD